MLRILEAAAYSDSMAREVRDGSREQSTKAEDRDTASNTRRHRVGSVRLYLLSKRQDFAECADWSEISAPESSKA